MGAGPFDDTLGLLVDYIIAPSVALAALWLLVFAFLGYLELFKVKHLAAFAAYVHAFGGVNFCE